MDHSENLESTVEAILEEIVRIHRMPWEELKTLGVDLLFEISASGGRKFRTGRRAWTLLRELSDGWLGKSELNGRVSADNYFKLWLEEFGRAFLNPERVHYDDAAVTAALARTTVKAEGTCEDFTHFIPCQFGDRKRQSFTIGPVRFLTRDAFLKRHASLLNKPAANDDAVHSKLSEDVSTYYGAFSWVAQVTVHQCDKPTSLDRANAAVAAAANYIHVMAGAGYSHRMRVAGPAISSDRRAHLLLSGDGKPEMSSSWSWEGANIGDEWWKEWDTEWAKSLTQAVGVAISTLTLPTEPKLASERFIDACSWYGDAAREQSDAARVVKYITAMERLLSSGERFGIAKRISARAAALTFDVQSWNFHEIQDDIERAYEVRSNILHGRISPFDPSIREQAGLCERLARDLIIVWIERYGVGFYKSTTSDKLKAHLDDFVAGVRAEPRSAEGEAKRATAKRR